MLQVKECTQFLKTDLDTLWDFMSSPKNLAKITPSYMGFHILSDLKDEKMYPGQIIEYHVSPIAGIKMHWVTEITHVQDKAYFVDEQRKGPYALWHHKHFLKEVNGGVEMRDVVHYLPPFGMLGKIANVLFIKRQLNDIFDHRFKVLDEKFNRS